MATSTVWRRKGDQIGGNYGEPLAGGYLQYRYAGTNLDYPTFKDFNLSISHPTTIYLDAAGRMTDPIYVGVADLKELLFDSSGVQIFSQDDYPGAV